MNCVKILTTKRQASQYMIKRLKKCSTFNLKLIFNKLFFTSLTNECLSYVYKAICYLLLLFFFLPFLFPITHPHSAPILFFFQADVKQFQTLPPFIPEIHELLRFYDIFPCIEMECNFILAIRPLSTTLPRTMRRKTFLF